MTMAPKSYKGIAGLLLKTQWCNDKVSGWYTADFQKKIILYDLRKCLHFTRWSGR